MKVDHLSASSIKTFEQCPYKYYAVYELCVPDSEPHPNTNLGSAVHRAFERACKSRIASVDSPESDPFVHKAAVCAEFKVTFSCQRDFDKLVKIGLEWGYLSDVSKTKGVELKFEFTLGSGMPVTGYIDRIDVDGENCTVFDLKTGKRDMKDSELKEDWQARIYNVADRKLYPEVRNVTVAFWCLRYAVRPTVMTAEDAERTLYDLEIKAREIQACDRPWPDESPLCTWCPALSICPKKRPKEEKPCTT